MRLEPQQDVVFGSSTGFAYSFWFYDPFDGDAPAHGPGGIFIVGQTTGQISGVTVLQYAKQLSFRSHGFITSETSWYNPDIVLASGSGFKIRYEPKKLNHFLFLKKNSTSMEAWFNGQRVAYNTNTAAYYPDSTWKFWIDSDHKNSILAGDIACWNEDISDIAEQVYNNGIISNPINLSKPPMHYWRLGEPSNGGIIQDIGTDGTNYLETPGPLTYEYVLATVNGTNAGYKFGSGLNTVAYANTIDQDLFARIGDPISFTNNTGGHPLVIKDSNDFIVAEEDATTKITSWTPRQAGTYRYYCVTHPDAMGANIYVVAGHKYSQTLALTSSSSSSSSGSDDPATVVANIIASPENVLGQTEEDGSVTSLNTAFGSDFDNLTVTPVTSLSTEELEVVAASSSVSNSLSSKTDILTFGTDEGSYRTESANFKDNLSPVIMITADIGFIIKDLSGSINYGTQFIFQSTGESEITLSGGSMTITFADADNLSVSNILEILAASLNDTWSFALVKLEAQEVMVPDSGTAFGDQTGSITLNGFTNSGPTNITGDIVTDTSTIDQNTSSSTSIDVGSSLMQNPGATLFKIYKQLDDGPSYHNISPGWTIEGSGAYSIGVHLDKDHVIILSNETGDAISGGGSFADKGSSGSISSSTASTATYFTVDKSKNPAGFLADIKSLYQAQDGGATDKWSYAILKVTSFS
jgi:hypothetical protein